MRIAGINSTNYHHNQPHKPKNAQSTAEAEKSGVARPDSRSSAAPANGEIQNNSIVVHQKGALMQPTANDLTGNSENVDARARYYSINASANIGGAHHGASPQAVWNSYQGTDAGETSTAIPDNTSLKARSAISEYLQTQFIEERFQFTEALGVDEYA